MFLKKLIVSVITCCKENLFANYCEIISVTDGTICTVCILHENVLAMQIYIYFCQDTRVYALNYIVFCDIIMSKT